MLTSKLRVALLLSIVALLFAVFAAERSRAQIVTNGSAVTVTLKEQLEAGLLARTPDERAFVNRVVAAVKYGTLPQDLVQSTFLWARVKRPYPMVYFQRALTLRAQSGGFRF